MFYSILLSFTSPTKSYQTPEGHWLVTNRVAPLHHRLHYTGNWSSRTSISELLLRRMQELNGIWRPWCCILKYALLCGMLCMERTSSFSQHTVQWHTVQCFTAFRVCVRVSVHAPPTDTCLEVCLRFRAQFVYLFVRSAHVYVCARAWHVCMHVCIYAHECLNFS